VKTYPLFLFNLSTVKSRLMEERKSVKEVKITVSKEEVEKLVDEVALRISKNVRVQGFRPGKAPISMVKSMYMDRIIEEAVNEALNRKVGEIIEEKGWKLITNPRIKAQDQNDSAYEFTVEFEIIPEFELPDLTSITVKKRIKRVTDSDVEERINLYKEENAQLKAVDREVREGDLVVSQYIFRDKEGNEGKPKRARIIVKSSELDEDLYNAIIGKKAGERVEIPVEDGTEIYIIQNIYEKVYPDDHEIAELLGYTSVSEMREKIKEKLIEEFSERAEIELENSIINEIYRLSPFDPPPTLVAKIYGDIKGELSGKVPPQELEQSAQNLAIFRAITEIILLKLIEEKNIDVSEEDIIKYLKEDGQQNPEAFLNEAKKRGKLDELKSRYLARKAFDYLKNTVKIEPEFVE